MHQMVAKLIQKNKGKGNRLASVKIKSESSIPIDIYGWSLWLENYNRIFKGEIENFS